MTSKEWLNTILRADGVDPAMEKLIIKYGEMLLEENQTTVDGSDLKFTDVSHKNIAKHIVATTANINNTNCA